jgi:UDPglucose 6-dehydrogenase
LRGRKVTLLGVAFKPGTDDVRDAPALTIVRSLEEKGVLIRATDPMVTELTGAPDIKIFSNPYEAMRNADALVLLTEWPEFLDLDYSRVAETMAGNVIIDGRNALDPESVMSAGLVYEGIGRFASRK